MKTRLKILLKNLVKRRNETNLLIIMANNYIMASIIRILSNIIFRDDFKKGAGFYIISPKRRRNQPLGSFKQVLLISLLILSSNYLTYRIFSSSSNEYVSVLEPQAALYLLDKAEIYVKDLQCFEEEVRRVSSRLNVPPEWLMAVMYFESKFNPSVRNYRGSGAVGLIQFMIPSVKDLNQRYGSRWYMNDIQNMSAVQQLILVEQYLETVQDRYGDFHSLTDLYLGILYPRAITSAQDAILFANPSKRYKQNIGLDFNKDGQITKKDIEQHLHVMFPSALLVRKNS